MNVKFFRLNRSRIEQALRRDADSLAEDPRVLAVVLFGSLARGDATAMSDADVLIILSTASEPFHTRMSAFLRPGMGIAMDVFPIECQGGIKMPTVGIRELRDKLSYDLKQAQVDLQ